MKFSCGETWETKAEWHPFFALWPRTIGAENGRRVCAWLEWIERRGEYFLGERFGWEYRSKP